MYSSDEMIPVCDDFALESFTSYLGESVALEGSLKDAKDSIETKIGNMKDAVLDKLKKTSKGKTAEALKNDKNHILKEQAKVAKAAKESRELVIALKNNQISPEDFTLRFKAATEAVRISKAMVGIGSTTELTLQDLKDYTSFLNDANTVIDEAIAGLEAATTKIPDKYAGVEIDEAAIEGVWNCAYDAYTRNFTVAAEGMNITKKPLTKQEFQAVFNQEKVREDENLRNAIAHGKYSRTELVDMGLLKEDSDKLGKGEFEQLLVDYEKELNEMKGKDEEACADYVKKHKLPHHLIYCISGDDISTYEEFIKAAKDEKKEEKAEKAEESAKVGSFTIVSKPEELEDADKKTAQVKHNEAEAKKVEDGAKNQNKQDKMPESDTKKQAPDKMNKAQESVEDSDFLKMLDSIIELGDEEAIAAIEAMVNEMDDCEEEALEGKVENLKSKISEKFAAVKQAKANDAMKKEIESLYQTIKTERKDIKNGEKVNGIQQMVVPQTLRANLKKIIALIEGNLTKDTSGKYPAQFEDIYKDCADLYNKILDSDDSFVDGAAYASTADPTITSTDNKDMDEAAKKFTAEASVVKEHLVAVKPRYAKDRKGCSEELLKIMKEVENLLPCASEITDSDEKIKAYDYITQQRAALQKALDNIPPDVSEETQSEEETEKEEESTETSAVATESSSEDEKSKEETSDENSDKE